MTNLEKYNNALTAMGRRVESYVEAFFREHQRPAVLYAARGNTVEEWTVEKIELSHGFYSHPKPSSKQVADIRQALALPLNTDPDKLFVYIERGRSSAAVSWEKLFDHSRGYYVERADAEAAAVRHQEVYGAREGHSPCAQCGKQWPDGAMVTSEIHLYGGKRERRRFCSGECAGNNQFAQEG